MRVKALTLQPEKKQQQQKKSRPQQRRGSEAVLPSHNTSLQILTLSYFVCLLLWAEDGPTRLTRNIYKKRTSAAVHGGFSGNIPPSWTPPPEDDSLLLSLRSGLTR